MRIFYLFVILTLFLSTQTVSADCTVLSTLKLGSAGVEVVCLQQKVGVVADGKFGPLTLGAVAVWQASNALVPDGVVGPMTRAVLNFIPAVTGNYPEGCVSSFGFSSSTGLKCDGTISSVIENTPIPIVKIPPPKVFSVSPEKVRSGDTVKIYGENFSSTGNTVRLRYAQIEARFENLPSSDGKVISFVYQPAEVKAMNKEELFDLPSTILNNLLDPIKAVGGSVDDIVAPYRNIKDENELRRFLNNNGHDFDELYDRFYVTIENAHGRGSSNGPILAGLRKLSIGSNLAKSDKNFFTPVINFLTNIFTPQKTYAQTPEGGFNSGVIMYCTCGEGYLTYMTDLSSNGGSGFYWWSSGFVPTVGTPMVSGPQLGFFIQNAGVCVVGAAPYCTELTANIVSLPWGQNP